MGSNEDEGEMKVGAVYLGHIPHGFYEKEMKSYFSQFGEVKRVKLFRSYKTGRSRGFGFIVFACSDVANIVAETHNNYILHDRLLKCRVVEPSSLTWKILKPFRIKPKQIVKQPRTQREIGKRVKGLLRRESKRRKRLKDLGIDYDFPGYVSCIKSNEHLIKTSKHTIFNEEDD